MKSNKDICYGGCRSQNDMAIIYAKKFFKKNDVSMIDFNFCNNHVDEQGDKCILSSCKYYRLLFFYYHIVDPESKNNIRSELKMIGLTSLIEKTMSDIEYIEFRKFITQNMLKKHDCYIKKVIEEYDQIYGLNRKVVKFFTENCTEEEKNEILISIKYYNKSKTLVSFLEDNKDIGDFASLLYKMRSDFVHNAEMHMFPGDSVSGYWFFLGKELYQITLKEKRLLEIFEKSFVNFYKTNNKKTEFI